jgi:capsular polysaccharide transport system permease protein
MTLQNNSLARSARAAAPMRWVPRRTMFGTLKETTRILTAVALIDMKTRFGSSFLSYLIAILWPLSHMIFIMIGFFMSSRLAPMGNDPAVFAGSGLLPYILCLYPARLMALAVLQNKFLLNLQIIKPIHLIVGRAIVEVLTALAVCIIFYSALLLLGVDFLPLDGPSALGAILASIYLGIGIGTVNALLAGLFGHYVVVAFIVLMIGAYLTSAIIVPFAAMPEIFRTIAIWNPIFHCVQWFRSTYYLTVENDIFSVSYILMVASASLAIGLAGERFMRGKYT